MTTRPLHVDYVSDPIPGGSLGDAVELLAGANLPLLALGALGGVVALLLAPTLRAVPDVDAGIRTLASYRPYVPWMLRLSLGLPLVGAGFAGYFVSPSVPVAARLFQVVVGFLLLFGLFTRAVAAIGLLAYLVVFPSYPQLILSFEYVGGFLAIIVAGSGQPSADGMFRRIAVTDGTYAKRLGLSEWFVSGRLREYVSVDAVAPIVRVTLGVNFVFLGLVEKLLNKDQALSVVAKYDLTAVVPVSPETWVVGAGLTEIAVGLALIAGVYTRGVGAVAFLLFTTTLFGLPDDPVLAHVSLFGLTSALLVLGSGPYALSVPPVVERLPGVGSGGRTATADGDAVDGESPDAD
jgi:uncharacterized membrane protein YphA (DoxX/SURF4 family)